MNATCSPALDRLQRGERGDDRLAAADVALQQPLHRRRALEVVADLAPHALLRARQLERHAREQRAGQRAGAGQHRRAPRGARLAMRLERELLREQLVELEARPRRMRARVERALRERRQAAAAARAGSAPRRRTSTAGAARSSRRAASRPCSAGSRGERARDDLAQRFLREPRGRRIDRRQPVGQRRVRSRRP